MNHTQLIGYLGKDPLIRQCNNGNKVAIVKLATHVLQHKTGKWSTIWHEVRFWGEKQVKQVASELISGSHVLVEGKLYYDRYADRSGHTRYVTQIHANRYINLDR